MSRQMRVVIKRPDEEVGHATFISNTLENLQKTVEGYIEPVYLEWDGHEFIIICNEEGRLLGLPYNCGLFGMTFYGTLVFVGVSGEDFADFPMLFAEYKQMLEEEME